jgi:ribonuclease P protein component
VTIGAGLREAALLPARCPARIDASCGVVTARVLEDCMRTSAPRLIHLTKRSEFQAAAGNGRRFRSSALAIQVLDRPDDGEGIRIGLTASRKAGNAVKRNRIRRRLRAAAREAFATATADRDIVAVARPETISAGYGELVRSFRDALTKARPQRTQRHPMPDAMPVPAAANADGTANTRRTADAHRSAQHETKRS